MSGRLSAAAVVEGSLIAVLEDDSSDDESDCGSPSTIRDYGERSKDDQQEELEVFVVPKAKLSSYDNGKKMTDTKSETSLASALAASVRMVESLGKAEAVKKNSQIGKLPQLSQASPSPKYDTPEGDIFGIAYKPFIKKKEEYSLPKLSAFEDEFAFEEELRLPAQIKKTIEGDEFDFEESAGPKKSVEKLVPIHKPVGNAEKIKKAAEEEAKFIAVLKDENKMLLQKQSVVPPPSSAESSSTQDTKSSITVSARQSLDEIVSIYSSGLGDQEVRLLDMKSGDESARRRSSFNQHNRGVSTIDEGDEDEAEKEEHEQEQREIIALDTEQNLREKLEAEWDTVDASNAGLTLNGHANTDSEFSEMSYAETLTYLSAQNMSAHEKTICVRNEAVSNWSLLNRPTALKFNGSEEKLKFPFLIAQVDYNPSTPPLFDALRTIYKALLASRSSKKGAKSPFDPLLCPRIGPHWERIGFQGLDPRTDINRSMKMLAILQTLHLIETAPSLVAPSFAISNLTASPSTGGHDLSWPFMCVSIMFTKEAVQAIRSGELNKECNRQMNVLSVMNEFHQACFFDFVRRVIEDPLTHHAMHLAKVREFCSKNPTEMLKLSRAAASKNYSALSLVDMYAKIRHSDRTVSSEDSRRSTKDKSAAGVGKGNTEVGFTMKTYEVSSSDAGDIDFDDLETIEKGLEAKDEADSNEEKRSFSKSVWLNLTGGNKAAKFKV